MKQDRAPKHKLLIACVGISIGLLIVFLISQDNDAKMLGLEAKWLLVSGIPILLALLLGGYIKTFKGFGVELESGLREPVPLSVVEKFEAIPSPALDKESIMRLHRMQPTERGKITRLRFFVKRPGYYNKSAIAEHFQLLENLQYIELVNAEGGFLYLLPASKLKFMVDEDVLGRTRQFIKAIENEDLGELSLFSVSDHVNVADSTIEVYRKLKQSPDSQKLDDKTRMLPVLDDAKIMVGLVELMSVAKVIADEVERSLD